MTTATASQTANAVAIAPFDATWFDADAFGDIDGDHKKGSMKRSYGAFKELHDVDVAYEARDKLRALAKHYDGERAPLIVCLERQAAAAYDAAIDALRPIARGAVTRLFYAWLRLKLCSRIADGAAVKQMCAIDVGVRRNATFCPYQVAMGIRYRSHVDPDTLKARSIVLGLYSGRTSAICVVLHALLADALEELRDGAVESTTVVRNGDVNAVKNKHKPYAHMRVVLRRSIALNAATQK